MTGMNQWVAIPTLEQIGEVMRAVVREEMSNRDERPVLAPNPFRRFSVKQLADEYNLTESKIRNRIHHNTIPYHRDGGSIYFIASEIESWITKQ